MTTATIEEFKLDFRLGFSETPIRCNAIQILFAGVNTKLVCSNKPGFTKEEQLEERLDQAILDVINNLKKNYSTTDFKTLL